VAGVKAVEGDDSGISRWNDPDPGTPYIATTGTMVIGSHPCLSFGEEHLYHSEWGSEELVATFSRLAYSVEADFIFDNMDHYGSFWRFPRNNHS
jgi:hypothetical protein